jgi:putative NIF3 family GTP cyclohydrolase 1 type 2
MKIDLLAKILDHEFRVASFKDGIIDVLYATDPSAQDFSRHYLSGRSGLMLRNSSEVNTIYFSLFPSPEIFDYLSNGGKSDALLLIKHPMDWEELGRGFVPLTEEQKKLLKRKRISLYSAHAPLDNSVDLSPSFNLALGVPGYIVGELTLEGRNYGWFVSTTCRDYTSLKLQLSNLTGLNRFQERFVHFPVKKVAIIPGGGDSEKLLDESLKAGCDTYVSGILYFEGSEYAKRNNPAFIAALKKSRVNALGLSHYASESKAIMPVTRFLRDLTALPIEGIKEKNKLRKLINFWGGNI